MKTQTEREALRADIRAAHEAAKDLRAAIRAAKELIDGNISAQIDTKVRRELTRLSESAERAMAKHADQIGQAFDRMVVRLLRGASAVGLDDQVREFRHALYTETSRREHVVNGNRRTGS